MADRIQVNFGWLNDYSGAKFAPLTLSDKILMPDEDKTFGDYVEDNFDSFKTRLTKAEEDIDILEHLSEAMHDPLHRIEIPEAVDKTKTIIDVFGANYLLEFPDGYYVLSDSDYNSNGTVKESVKNQIVNTYGISEGLDTENNRVLPIYFKDGKPMSHAAITNLYSVNDKLLSFRQGSNLKTQWSRLADFGGQIDYDIVDATDANKTKFRVNDSLNDVNGLNVNIKGNARTSSIALHALQAKLAHFAHDAAIARSAKKLDYDVKFSNAVLPKADNIERAYGPDESHIQGLIKFNNQNFEDGLGTHIIGLRLVDILNENGTGKFDSDDDISATSAGSYGASQVADYNTAEALSSFNVPNITVDVTGRITSISQRAIKPSLNVRKISNNDTTTKAAVLGYLDGTLVHAGALDDTGIYIDWSDGVDNAVLMGAAWNDYAEFRKQIETIPAGYCVASQDNGQVYKTTEKFQACDGIVSDTFGFSIGRSDSAQTPLAVSGRVLAYYNGSIEDYHAGDTVCAGPEGKICKMTREEIREWPDRIIGIVSEIPTYEYWNKTIPTKGRIWIKIK